MDIEKGQNDSLNSDYWQTDTSLDEDWFYTPKPLDLTDALVVQNLCDIASTNGDSLLNVSLQADGTLPEQFGVLPVKMGIRRIAYYDIILSI